MSVGLRHKTVNALLWSSLDRFGSVLILFLVNIVLARMLFPEDFGLIGMIMVFIAISNSIVDSGFGAALIQKKDVSKEDYSTIFYLNVALGIVFFIILYATSPLIASFYEQSQLTVLLRALAIVLVINAFVMVQSAILQKAVDFKKIARINIVSALLSGLLAIGCAIKGLGVWSLAIQVISNSCLKCVLYWITNPWRPMLIFSMQSLKNLFGYGSKLLLSGLLDTTYQNLQSLIIGKVFNSKDLGYYTQAQRLQDAPGLTISSIVTQVTFPVFSTLQDDNEKMKIGVKKSLKALVFINFPLMVLLAVIAKPLIVLLFTDKWIPSILYFQLLCAAGMLFVLHTTTLSILKAKGRSDIFLKLEILKKTAGVALIVIGIISYGIIGMIIGMIVSSYVSYFLNGFYSGRIINYKLKDQLKDIFPYFIISIVVGIIVFFAFQHIILNNLLLVIIQTVGYALIYLLIARIFNFEPYHDYRQIINDLILRKKKSYE